MTPADVFLITVAVCMLAVASWEAKYGRYRLTQMWNALAATLLIAGGWML